ncbi:hypothetical protein ANCDUO_26235 [Ancylostoma duodenale]|uniref:Uncharacterized protein n=1 Tax=Ancylostoma duodenale TaxID=51022 RepID=A0A0C2BIZ2_9BILA|nr:hypothetical protein ANCDUO_26235 [Ancylostoma duodenale]
MLGFRFGTINCRTLRTKNRIAELEDAIGEVPFDITGLSGTQRTGSAVLRPQKSSHFIFFSELTGFVVNKKWTDCCSFYTISGRASFVDVTTISGSARVVQVYAPTTAHPDEEHPLRIQ